MAKIKYISRTEFNRKFKIKDLDLIKQGFFSTEDLIDRDNSEIIPSIFARIKKLSKYIFFSLKNPSFIKEFLIPAFFRTLLYKVYHFENSIDTIFIKQYNLRASIVASLKPRTILEIGTYLGWGAACFKFVLPMCGIYTMNPENDKESNNPISKKDVGIVCKKKGLRVKQIWADSTTYDYSQLPKIDLAYIDGNHEYEYVLSDLRNVYKIGVKYILVDDYIPKEQSTKYGLIYSPWNEGVVRATDDFLKNKSDIINSYWIEGTKLAILISV